MKFKKFLSLNLFLLFSFCFSLFLFSCNSSHNTPQTNLTKKNLSKEDYFLFKNKNPHIPQKELYSQYYQFIDRKNKLKSWTVLIYMQADNDLSPYALWDIYEMERKIKGLKNQGTSSEKIDILLEVDFKKKKGLRRFHIFQSEKFYKNLKRTAHKKTKKDFSKSDFEDEEKVLKKIESPLVSILPEKPPHTFQSQHQSLTDFLLWGVENYPSKYYMVIVWGHGKGYFYDTKKGIHQKGRLVSKKAQQSLQNKAPTQTTEDINLFSFRGGVAFDESNGSFLDIPSLKQALFLVNSFLLGSPQSLLHNTPQKINVLAMDACLMQTLEVNTELSSEIDYFLASSQVQNYMGLPYRVLWDELNEQPYMKPFEWSLKIPSLFSDSLQKTRLYETSQWNDSFFSFNYSALPSSELHIKHKSFNFLSSFMNFSKTLHKYLKQNHPYGKRQLLYGLQNSPYFIGHYRDIGNFIGLVLKLLKENESDSPCYNFTDKSLSTKIPLACQLKNQSYQVLEKLNRTMSTYSYGHDYIENKKLSFQDTYLLGFFKGLSVWLPSSHKEFDSQWDYMKHSFLLTKKEDKDKNSWREFLLYLFKHN